MSEHRHHIRLGLLITALGGLLYTFELPLLRLAGADAWTLLFARGVLLFLSTTAGWYAMRRVAGVRAPFIDGWAGLAIVGTNTLAPIAYVNAITLSPAANVVFITALIPIATALMSFVLLREHVHRWTWLATALSFLGVGFIVWQSLGAGTLAGDALALLSCLCTAAAFTVVRASGKNVTASLGLGSLMSGLIALPFASPAMLTADGWLWVSLAGLFVLPLATALISHGPRYLPSADVSMFFLLETALTPIWIYLLFAEVPARMVLAGGAIILVTLLIHSYWRFQVNWREGAKA